ncbi:MAG: flagellar basal body-associated FliL family protein [Kofleriaceae bacterium]
MSDDAAKAAETPKGPKPSKVVLALLVLNLGASGFGTFKLVTAKPAPASHPVEEEKPVTSEVVGPVLALDPFIVNLDEPGQSRYLKVTLQLELRAADVEAAINKSKQLIRDTILSHLSGLKLADTLGAAAKDKLRTDLMAKLDGILGQGRVRRMFFQDFVVQ